MAPPSFRPLVNGPLPCHWRRVFAFELLLLPPSLVHPQSTTGSKWPVLRKGVRSHRTAGESTAALAFTQVRLSTYDHHPFSGHADPVPFHRMNSTSFPVTPLLARQPNRAY